LAEIAGVEPAGSHWRLPLELRTNRLTGDDDLPRLDCYMEAGRIIATFNQLPHLYLPFSASFFSLADGIDRNLNKFRNLHFDILYPLSQITEIKKRNLITRYRNSSYGADGLQNGNRFRRGLGVEGFER